MTTSTAPLDIQAALDEVAQQRGRDGGVLGRAVPRPERVLDAVGVDRQRDDAAAALELDPVEHRHHQAQILERAAHRLDQVLARARDKLATDRRLAGRAGRLVDRAADRLAGAGAAARGDAGQHPLEHHVGRPIARGEVRIGGQLDLALAIGGPRTRAAHRDAPAAERDLAGVVAVAHRRAIRVMLALAADDLVDLGPQRLVQHPEPDADTHREQAPLRGTGELAERLPHRQRQPLDALLMGRDRRGRYGPHRGRSSRPRDLDSHSPRSQPDRTRREDRRPKFYGLRDNL
jgi:hypothetical protein